MQLMLFLQELEVYVVHVRLQFDEHLDLLIDKCLVIGKLI